MPYTPKFTKNNATAVLTVDNTSTIDVDVSGYTLPTDVSSGNFYITINSEILLVTGVTNNTTYYTLNVTRGQEGTTPATHSASSEIRLNFTAGLYNELATQISTNTAKLDYIDVTSSINLNTLSADVTTNNAKVTNATHSGDVSGATTLTINPSAISDRSDTTPVTGDFLLFWDATDSALKKANASHFINTISTDSTSTFTNKRITKRVVTLVDAATVDINCDNLDVGKVTLTASRTLGTPTGTPTDGQQILLQVQQGGSGSYTLTPDSTTTAGSYRFGSDVTGLTLSTAVGKNDLVLLTYLSDVTGWCFTSIAKGY